jgi:hypothetical protein
MTTAAHHPPPDRVNARSSVRSSSVACSSSVARWSSVRLPISTTARARCAASSPSNPTRGRCRRTCWSATPARVSHPVGDPCDQARGRGGQCGTPPAHTSTRRCRRTRRRAGPTHKSVSPPANHVAPARTDLGEPVARARSTRRLVSQTPASHLAPTPHRQCRPPRPQRQHTDLDERTQRARSTRQPVSQTPANHVHQHTPSLQSHAVVPTATSGFGGPGRRSPPRPTGAHARRAGTPAVGVATAGQPRAPAHAESVKPRVVPTAAGRFGGPGRRSPLRPHGCTRETSRNPAVGVATASQSPRTGTRRRLRTRETGRTTP